MLKKLVCFLCLLMTALTAPALADSEADQYLVDKVWEMNIGDWGNTEYMFFGRDGYGFMARRYEKSSARLYYFYWQTWTESATLDTYIRIDFAAQQPPVNGWSLYNNPHQHNAYLLLWNPDFIYMIDMEHAAPQRHLHLFNGQYPAPYLIEKYTREANAFFQ